MVAMRWQKGHTASNNPTSRKRSSLAADATHRRRDKATIKRNSLNSWLDATPDGHPNGMSVNEAATIVQAVFRARQACRIMKKRRLQARRRTLCGLICSKMDYFPILHPSGRNRLIWDCFSMIFLVYNIVIVPYRIAWDSNASVTSGWFILESLIDWFFVFDILLNFRTAVKNHHTNVITEDSMAIAKEYWRSWFLIDFVSSCPVDFFVMTVGNPEGGSTKMLKLFRILRLSKLLKLVKILKVQSIFEELQDYYYVSDTYKKVASMLSITIYLAHMLACMWMFTTRPDEDGWYQNEGRFYARDFGANETGADHAHSTSTEANYKEYVWCVYWALTTMSTVGYGDITPSTEGEAICVMVAMIVGNVACQRWCSWRLCDSHYHDCRVWRVRLRAW
jgi:hypothetical protein